QAEDGLRCSSVTGVQTCALPILARLVPDPGVPSRIVFDADEMAQPPGVPDGAPPAAPLEAAHVAPKLSLAEPDGIGSDPRFAGRSEERRVGKGRRRPKTTRQRK